MIGDIGSRSVCCSRGACQDSLGIMSGGSEEAGLTTEGIITVMDDSAIHQYVIDFAKSNIRGEEEQARFVEDVWIEVSQLEGESPSLHLIALVVWRQSVKRIPILARLAEGYTQAEAGAERGIKRSAVCRRVKRIASLGKQRG